MVNKISSFAVFDLETACLPDWNFNKSSITEISIHGFKTDDVTNALDCSIPRINHKLTLLFNPRMMIHPDSEQITHLNNKMLENESAMDVNAANIIINFLKHLRQPVCLVAHNGDKFDFPILKQAFSKLKMELPEGILCLDSLPTIKDLDLKQKETSNEDTNEDFVVPLSDIPESMECKKKLKTSSDENNDSQSVLIMDDVNIPLKSDKIDSLQEKLVPEPDRQILNETTPKRMPNYKNIEIKRKRESAQELCQPAIPSSRKCLFSSTPTMTPISTPTKVQSYKLSSIYERLFGNAPSNAHHAEADVISLKKIILSYGKSFVDYAEKNAKPFSEVKKLGAR